MLCKFGKCYIAYDNAIDYIFNCCISNWSIPLYLPLGIPISIRWMQHDWGHMEILSTFGIGLLSFSVLL